MKAAAFWEREERKLWTTMKGDYAQQCLLLNSYGAFIATVDDILRKRLEFMMYDSDLFQDIATIDALAVYDGMIRLDLDSHVLKNLNNYQIQDGAAILNEEDFLKLNSKKFLKENLEGMLLPDEDKLQSNSLWTRLSKFQPALLRKYFSAVDKKSKGNAMRIILPEDSKVPKLYPLKLGSIDSGSFLSIQYLDEKAVVAGYRFQ